MIEYTVNDNLNISFGGPDLKRVSDDQNGKSFKRPLGNRDQRFKPNEPLLDSVDDRLMPALNMQGAFNALEQLLLNHFDSRQLSEETIKVFTGMLQVDGVCIYKCAAEGAFEVLACNPTWSMLRAMEEGDAKNVLLNPSTLSVLLSSSISTKVNKIDQATKVIPLSFGTRNYGSFISLPLVCDGATLGAISLFSVHPQFFLPERINVMRMAACIIASLYMNIHVKNILEKEQIERITLQKEIQILREQKAYTQTYADTSTGADAAYNELEALSYSVSHDLRGPILAIKNNCEWLSTQHSVMLDSEGHELLKQITSSSEHMEKLLDGLLAFSRVVQLSPQQSLIDMTTLVRTVIDELLKSESGSSSLSIAVQPLLPAFGDATLIRQVWYNLLSNAFKYSRYKQKREVIIDSHPFNGGVKYCVSDNGIGFDMQYVDRLFGAFHRLHVAEEFEGTGVGLAIVQRIVRRHGGQVWAEGIVDKGARFYFTLPKT